MTSLLRTMRDLFAGARDRNGFPGRGAWLAYWAVPLLLALLIGLFTLDGQFVQDDYPAIVYNTFITGDAPFYEAFVHDFWGIPLSDQVTVYRPLMPVVWKAVCTVLPCSPLPFRILSLFLHLLATLLVIKLSRRVWNNDYLAWATGAIFSVHAVHAEAVGGIVSQADLLATVLGIFALLSFYAKSRFAQCLVPLLLILAYLAKESAVIFGITIIILTLANATKRSRAQYLIFLATIIVTAAYIFFQLSLPRYHGGLWQDNLAYDARGMIRVLHGLYVVGRAVAMCFIPIGLSPNHSYAAIELFPDRLLPYAVPGGFFLILGITGLAAAVRAKDQRWILWLCLFFGPVLIQSGFPVITNVDLAERLLYPATIGSSAMLAFLYRRYFGSSWSRAAMTLTLFVFIVLSWQAQRPWRSDLALFRYAVKSEPLSWRSRHGLAATLVERGEIREGIWYFLSHWYILHHHGKDRRVDPAPIEQLEKLDIEQRNFLAPGILAGPLQESPCLLIEELVKEPFIRHLRGYAAPVFLELQTLMPKYEEMYQCDLL